MIFIPKKIEILLEIAQQNLTQRLKRNKTLDRDILN